MTNWLDLINQSKTVALFSHLNSDGDANGSVMAMKHWLDDLGKETYVFVPTPINLSYCFNGVDKFSCTKYADSYDLAIGLDAPNTKRFGQCEKEFFKAKKSICFDHHLDNQNYANITIVDTDISSTCELLFKEFEQKQIKISKDVATNLYLGIATDTGGFMRSSHGQVNADTWRAVTKLIEYGADTERVNTEIFMTMRKPVFEIYRKGLDRVEFFENGRIAMVCISKKTLNDTGADISDTHRLNDTVLGIDGVEIMALMTQSSYAEQFVSVRSKGSRSARNICSYFGGGGHLRAAGCRIYVPFAEAKKQLLEQCIVELNRNE